jgi:hypothetical protein
MKTPPACAPQASPEGQELGHSAPSQAWVKGQPPSPQRQVETQKAEQVQKLSPSHVSVLPPSLPPPSLPGVQAPFTQSCPEAHWVPQLPQLSRLPDVSVQVPLQSIAPSSQPGSQAHVPDSHLGMQRGWAGQSQKGPTGVHAAGVGAPASMRQGLEPS